MEESKPLLRVFLSHAHEEAKLALILKERIKRDFLGLVKVFVSADRRDLYPGADWFDMLKCEISQVEVHAVLCSNRSLKKPWVNIELGGACFRPDKPPIIVPLCHSDVDMGALTPPLQLKQAIVISDVDGLKSLYGLLAQEIRCLPPSMEFDVMAGDVRAFEEEYRVSASRQEESERLLFTGDGATSQTIKNPEVLCISSRQLEETARADFELIRRALPMSLYHDVVVTSEELSTQLATRHYDIIHAALYICPF